MEEIEYESIIQWCCTRRYYGDMLAYAKQALDVYSSSDRIRVLLASALALNGHNKEALRHISALCTNDTSEASLPALLVQSYVYKKQGAPDRSALVEVDAKIRDDRRKASAEVLSLSATVLLLLGKLDKAKEYADRAGKLSPANDHVLLAKGWTALDDPDQDAGDYFEAVLRENSRHFDALLGAAKARELQGDHSGAMLILNPLVVRYPRLSLPLVEKMNNLLAVKEWDQVLETANRILVLESANVDAFKLKAVLVICRDGDYDEAARHVQIFFRSLIAAEPRNVELLIDNVQLFARIAVKNQAVLAELFKVTDKISHQNAGNSAVLVELGNLCQRMGKHKDAEHWYRGALRLEDTSYNALVGLARCQLRDNNSAAEDLAKQQVDFLMEMRPESPDPELFYMSAKLMGDQALKSLAKTAQLLIDGCMGLCYGCEYLKRLNPDLGVDVVEEYLLHSPTISDAGIGGSMADDGKRSCVELLDRITEACPGLAAALLLLGKVKMQIGDFSGASTALKKLLDSIDRTNASGHLLMAQVLVKQGHYESASQTLETALSYNFKVRNDPLYHMILGTVAKETGDLEGAIKNLEAAMSFAGLRQSQEGSATTTALSNSDKASLYLELVSAYACQRKFNEASIVIEEARTQLAGSPEAGRAIIGNAELCLEMDEVERAIELLGAIGPGQPYFLQARTKLADVHLKRRKDRYSFAKCFRELVEKCPGAETYSMLGDAYLAIQEPERAIESYELSLQSNPHDKTLVRKMGTALVKTHQYAKAVDYYKEVVKRDGCRDLKFDLAELLMKLKQFDKAEDTLREELNVGRGATDIPSLERRAKQLLLLAKVRERAGNPRGALVTLNEAKENQSRYLQRATMLPNLLEQKHVLADICFTMAEHASSIRDFGQAVDHYKDVLHYKPNDVKALLSLARLHMQMNELDKCAQYCQVLLGADPKNEAACVMMADLAFRKVDFDTAAFHFRQLLLQKPTYWTALARLIEVSRRTGNIDDLPEWLERAELAIKGAKPEAGFYYCSGLLDWRTGKVSSALRSFNAARRDPEWGQQAIYNMIEICLDPDDDGLASDVFAGGDDEDTEPEDSRGMALRTAQKLLHELNPKGNPQETLTHRLLSNFYLLATKQKHNIERALQDCTALASQESLRDHVGPALGLATAHILLKQTPRARNHLKRVSKNTWTFEDAEYLERCWMLLADIYVQSSKYDLASELLKRVVQHNATCVRAHELLGHVAEKEQSYDEAAEKYALAWKYGGKLKLAIGHKLAYCHFKSKHFADAIEACNEVLKIEPDYPRIRRDILEKSMHNLRT
ncbi:tetratricopeptide repeat protein 21B-like [Copidosoma floridanum]|uniref:tetratricopeptide repeat protein 21B-like n=1 Tax=Copidosoma floridanum TaxID=29053 RepID=UPI0006C9D788|nr:tetratricopeptide repeat protein 21B-like [Copidosoma floridanum]